MTNAVEVTGTQQVLITQTATNVLELTAPAQVAVVEVVTAGPQGAAGTTAGGLPTGGDPGNILLKSGTANYDATWAPVVDGGTFN